MPPLSVRSSPRPTVSSTRHAPRRLCPAAALSAGGGRTPDHHGPERERTRASCVEHVLLPAARATACATHGPEIERALASCVEGSMLEPSLRVKIAQSIAAHLPLADEASRKGQSLLVDSESGVDTPRTLEFLPRAGAPEVAVHLSYPVDVRRLGAGSFKIVLPAILIRFANGDVQGSDIARLTLKPKPSTSARVSWNREVDALHHLGALAGMDGIVATYAATRASERDARAPSILQRRYAGDLTPPTNAGPPLSAAEGRERLSLCASAARGLAHVHASGMVHLDIKPANLLVDDGRADVADFGGAITSGRASGFLTPLYLAPERAAAIQHGAPVREPSEDVYAFGVSLFEVMQGRLPDYLARARKEWRGDVLGFLEMRTPACAELEGLSPASQPTGSWMELVCSMLSPRPADRPTMEIVARRLDAILSEASPSLAHLAAGDLGRWP